MAKNQKGLSAVKIILIILAIGIVGAFCALLLNNSLKENRDVKRLADIRDIREALEFYFYNCASYPVDVTPGQNIDATACGGTVYLSGVPRDPRGQPYKYVPCNLQPELVCEPGMPNPAFYTLNYSLESNVSGILKGNRVATPERLY